MESQRKGGGKLGIVKAERESEDKTYHGSIERRDRNIKGQAGKERVLGERRRDTDTHTGKDRHKGAKAKPPSHRS